jgi:hypothetical protein
MWTAISNDRKTDLVHVPGNLTAVRYRDEIIQPHFMNVMTNRGSNSNNIIPQYIIELIFN